MKSPDAQIDRVLWDSLEDVTPPSGNSQFLADLRRRIEAEEAQAPHGGLRGWMLGFAGAAVVCLAVGAVALHTLRTVPPVPAIPTSVTAHEEMARFAAEHQGSAMVLQVNEHRGSRLFVAAPGQTPVAGTPDLSLPSAGDSLSLRGSGWIQTRRVTPPDQSS